MEFWAHPCTRYVEWTFYFPNGVIKLFVSKNILFARCRASRPILPTVHWLQWPLADVCLRHHAEPPDVLSSAHFKAKGKPQMSRCPCISYWQLVVASASMIIVLFPLQHADLPGARAAPDGGGELITGNVMPVACCVSVSPVSIAQWAYRRV